VHGPPGDHEGEREQARPDQVGNAEVGDLGEQATADRAAHHRDPIGDLPLGEGRLQRAGVPGRLQAVDQPGLGGAAEEGEPETEQHRRSGPGNERRAGLPQQQVEQGRAEQGGGAEQERDTPADGVRDDAGRHLEQHHPDGEERVHPRSFRRTRSTRALR
jgi:hypothetical protein